MKAALSYSNLYAFALRFDRYHSIGVSFMGGSKIYHPKVQVRYDTTLNLSMVNFKPLFDKKEPKGC